MAYDSPMEWLIVGMVFLVWLLYVGPEWTGMAITSLVILAAAGDFLYAIVKLVLSLFR